MASKLKAIDLINRIITGDCIYVMRQMDDESVGIILTSPPYNVGLNYEGFEDNLTDKEHKQFSKSWLAEAYRVTKETGRLYVVVGDKMLYWFKPLAETVGWKYVQKLVWVKPNLVGKSKISQDWNYMSEDILLFRKGKRNPMLISSTKDTTFNWIKATVPQSNFRAGRHHPAQFPHELCRKIISRTPGNPVLDPFAGSGQVLRTAKSLGRDYVGIELVDEVAKRARMYVSGTINKPANQLELMKE